MESKMDKSKVKYNIKTYGCKVNTYDSGLLQSRFHKSGFEYDKESDVHVLNTCAVTEEATKEAIRNIRQLKRKNPNCTVVVTGCAAQVDTDKFKDVEEVDLVVANSHKGKLEEYIQDHLSGKEMDKVFHSNIFEKEDLESGGGLEEGHSRAFLKIQDGCNSFCTYCVIPFARGKSRSIPIPELITKVNELYKKGIREVVITGIHIGDYASTRSPEDNLKIVSARGRKNQERYYFLEDLIEALLKQTEMPRFRISSLEPQELTDRLLDLYQDPRMCPHFHMSIQSANSKTLMAMKRKYDALLVEKALNSIEEKLPHAFVGMDVITGFPGETEEDFQDTKQRLEKLNWTRMHIFPYSDRPGTKAIDLDGKVYQHVKVERAKELRQISSDRFAEAALKQISSIKKVILLTKYKEVVKALSSDYWQIVLTNIDKEALIDFENKEYEVKITGFDNSENSRMDGCLFGELIGEI